MSPGLTSGGRRRAAQGPVGQRGRGLLRRTSSAWSTCPARWPAISGVHSAIVIVPRSGSPWSGPSARRRSPAWSARRERRVLASWRVARRRSARIAGTVVAISSRKKRSARGRRGGAAGPPATGGAHVDGRDHLRDVPSAVAVREIKITVRQALDDLLAAVKGGVCVLDGLRRGAPVSVDMLLLARVGGLVGRHAAPPPGARRRRRPIGPLLGRDLTSAVPVGMARRAVSGTPRLGRCCAATGCASWRAYEIRARLAQVANSPRISRVSETPATRRARGDQRRCGLLDELGVARRAPAGVVLEPDADMASASQGERGQAAVDDVISRTATNERRSLPSSIARYASRLGSVAGNPNGSEPPPK